MSSSHVEDSSTSSISGFEVLKLAAATVSGIGWYPASESLTNLFHPLGRREAFNVDSVA